MVHAQKPELSFVGKLNYPLQGNDNLYTAHDYEYLVFFLYLKEIISRELVDKD